MLHLGFPFVFYLAFKFELYSNSISFELQNPDQIKTKPTIQSDQANILFGPTSVKAQNRPTSLFLFPRTALSLSLSKSPTGGTQALLPYRLPGEETQLRHAT